MPLITVGLRPLTNQRGKTTSWTVTVNPERVQVVPAGPNSTITWSLGPESGTGPTVPSGAVLRTVVFGPGPGGTAFPGGAATRTKGMVVVGNPGNLGAPESGSYTFPYTVKVSYSNQTHLHDPEIVNSPPSG